ncbi:MAG: outer membrane lipoprotein carrier protein LolA [Parahaliea sp.]
MLALTVLAAGPVRAGVADDPLAQLAARLVPREALGGQFRQSTYLTFLEQPMVSSGEFCLDRTRGLRWQVREPLPSLMQVVGSTVTLDGAVVRDHGSGQLMARILLGFMEGDLAGLQRYFAVNGELASQPWRLQLSPKGRLQKIIERVELQGGDHLQQLDLREHNGTRTLIEFSAVSAGASDRCGGDVQ